MHNVTLYLHDAELHIRLAARNVSMCEVAAHYVRGPQQRHAYDLMERILTFA